MSDPLISSLPPGQQAIGGGSFKTQDIRLSSALCTLGFMLRVNEQPVDRTWQANQEREIVTFLHDSVNLDLERRQTDLKLTKFAAADVELWWTSPRGKYSIDGYDDALNAIQGVFHNRAKMILASKDYKTPSRPMGQDLATGSLHAASIIVSCGHSLLGYERPTKRWIFGKKSVPVIELILKGGTPEGRPMENDLCVDWMLEALRYHDWLKKIVKDPNCIPMIEARDGEKILRISSHLPDSEKRKWFSYL